MNYTISGGEVYLEKSRIDSEGEGRSEKRRERGEENRMGQTRGRKGVIFLRQGDVEYLSEKLIFEQIQKQRSGHPGVHLSTNTQVSNG